METLFWILVFLFALFAAWCVILMSATFPLPAAPQNEKPAEQPRRRRMKSPPNNPAAADALKTFDLRVCSNVRPIVPAHRVRRTFPA